MFLLFVVSCRQGKEIALYKLLAVFILVFILAYFIYPRLCYNVFIMNFLNL